jgi:hypothetical protein
MGFALWLDTPARVAWAQGTQEYRAMGAAVIAINGQFRHRDFNSRRNRPGHLTNQFAGFFGSLEEVNEFLRARTRRAVKSKPAATPPHAL